MLNHHSDYREWLRSELAARCSRNPVYSMRAFARDLDLRPSHLSEVLRGKMGLSSKNARNIAASLGLQADESAHFVTLVEAEHSRSATRRESAKAKLKTLDASSGFRTLEETIFEIISDWQCYAILELALTSNFVPRLSWIASRLGIKRVEVETAVQRLKYVGLLKIQNGKWMVTEKFPATKSGIPSTAIKKYHTQILNKALDALHLQSVEKRDFSAMTFAINPDDLPEIQTELREFRRALEKKYKARSHKREVYSLCIQFFSLTQDLKKLKKEPAHV